MARKNIENIIASIKDGAETVIDMPYGNSDELRLNSAFFYTEGSCFELFFPPDSWELDKLHLGLNCQIAVRHKGNVFNIIAELDGVVNDRRLSFVAREPIKPEDMREYFRVLINANIELSYRPGPKEVKVTPWKMVGTTIDLSGSGVLGLFADKPPSNNRLTIEIKDPFNEKKICCGGHVIRTYRMRKQRYQVALHFDDISSDARDQIIACCLSEQRKQLREKVEVEYPG